MTYDWHRTMREAEGAVAFFEEVDRRFFDSCYFAHKKDSIPFSRLIPYDRLRGRLVLEIGCGVGSLAAELSRQEACVCALDLADRSVALTKLRFNLYSLPGVIVQADGQRLPFSDNSFDYVWSWGVLHHTDDTELAIREVHRVLRPGGEAAVMLYHKGSFRYWVHLILIRGILMGKLMRMSQQDLVTHYTDGYVAKHYTRHQVSRLFSGFRNLRIHIFGQKSELVPIPASGLKTIIIKAIPNSLAAWFFKRFGWFLFAEIEK